MNIHKKFMEGIKKEKKIREDKKYTGPAKTHTELRTRMENSPAAQRGGVSAARVGTDFRLTRNKQRTKNYYDHLHHSAYFDVAAKQTPGKGGVAGHN